MKRIVTAALTLALGGCTMSHEVHDFTAGYEKALAATRASGPGRDEHMETFKDFMASLSPATIRQRTRVVYAPDAYLNDNLNEVRGAAAIEAHFASSLEGLSDITVAFHDTIRSGNDWYLRWTMSTTFRSLRDGATVVTPGMSHIRFDAQGRVVMHRDFWDASSGIMEHIPVLGSAIRMVKNKIAAQ